MDRRRFLARTGAATLFGLGLAGVAVRPGRAERGDDLIIAWPAMPPAWDPTVGTAALDPLAQSIWKSVFGNYIDRGPDLELRPGLIDAWGWSADRARVHLALRPGARWHDGRPVTPEDIVWNLKRAAAPRTGNPFQEVWARLDNFEIDGQTIRAEARQYVPDLFARLAFQAAYPLPPHYLDKAGKKGFARAPIGAGPYRVDRIEPAGGNGPGLIRLVASETHWAGRPAFRTVVFRILPDPAARAAAYERGDADIAVGLDIADLERLKALPGTVAATRPVTEIALIQLNDIGPMKDPNIRRAAHHAIFKRAIVDRLLKGYGAPIDTLEPPGSAGYDADIRVDYDPELAVELLSRSGYSVDRPVRFTLQTTRGHRPMDFETAQAIAAMWHNVGIEASVEVVSASQIAALAARDRLAPACFRVWDNASGAPALGTGALLWGPSPHSVWDTPGLDERLEALLWREADDHRRRAGWKALARHIAEQAFALPLYQYSARVVHRRELEVTPHRAGWILPHRIGRRDV